ncbi:MAG: circularly permuted type 2 ATP-grasp protein [Myxococcota bacterium]
MLAGERLAYERAFGFDEAVDSECRPRPHYAALFDELSQLTPPELASAERLRDAIFRRLGITFAVYGDSTGLERTWPMDLVPRIIPAAEWAVVERGLAQRVRALNLFLDDIYAGEAAAVRDGIVPRRLVVSSDGFVREAVGIRVPHGARCVVAGIDLVRDGDGSYRVLEDNLRTPSGISYVLENRATLARVMPALSARHRIRPVHHYASSLLASLHSIAPKARGSKPSVVVLTPGIYNSAYFEHAFLARQLGAELVEGRDLVVENHNVYARTTKGLERVDVIYRRVDDGFIDPAVFRPDSVLGVPGLMGALRAGNVGLANSLGCGVADDKAIYPYVPALIRYYLNEDAILPNVDTYLLWEPDQREAALARLHELVMKPVAASGGYGIVIGPQATEEQLEICRKEILCDPRAWIAQELVQLSSHPTFIDGRLEPRHIDLRPFILAGERIEVVPGGLTRVALPRGSFIVNSSQGGGSKDTWVLAEPEVH